MECHRCPYNGKADPHCLSCKPSESLSKRGQTFVSIDAAETGADEFLNHRKNRRDVTPADEAERDDGPDADEPDGLAEQLDKEDALRKLAATTTSGEWIMHISSEAYHITQFWQLFDVWSGFGLA